MNTMETVPVPPTKIRNPITRARHRHEVLWQITVPFIVALGLLLTIAVLVSLGANVAVNRAANVSLIWLILISFLPALLLLGTFIALVYLVYKFSVVLPFYTYRAQEIANLVQAKVRRGSDILVEPVLRVNSFNASLHSLQREIRRALRR